MKSKSRSIAGFRNDRPMKIKGGGHGLGRSFRAISGDASVGVASLWALERLV